MNLDFDRKQYDTFVAIFNCLILIGQNELNFGIGEGFALSIWPKNRFWHQKGDYQIFKYRNDIPITFSVGMMR